MTQNPSNLNKTPSLTAGFNKHAVVIGGSVAGLLAARVLSNHFEQVTIIERDTFDESENFRKGVPQSHQVHVLLTQGQRILEQLFPGIGNDLKAQDTVTIDWTADYALLSPFGWIKQFKSELITQASTRQLLEATIRRRLQKDYPIQILEACQVTELLTDAEGKDIKGVVYRDNQQNPEKLFAQLVVDASGRNSQASQWLASLGYEKPEETVINAFFGYASRWYQRPTDFKADWKLVNLMAQSPKMKRGGVLYPVEGQRWILTLIGVGKDYPPSDEEEFLEFVRSLRSPVIYEAIQKAEPLSPIYSYRRTENRWLHYEKLTSFPENFIIVGDAACSFNPVYGQGMTIAALDALTLDQCLNSYKTPSLTTGFNKNTKGFSRYFQQKLAQVIKTPWLMATGEDFRWETTVGGQRDFMSQIMQNYIDRVWQVSLQRPEIYHTFQEVFHLLKPPSALFSPFILAQVIKSTLPTFNEPPNKEVSPSIS